MKWVKTILILPLLFPIVAGGEVAEPWWHTTNYTVDGRTINDVAAPGYEPNWVVGDSGLIMKGEEDSWQDITISGVAINQPGWDFKGVCKIPASDLYIVGVKRIDRKGIILKSTNDGDSWSATYLTADGYDLACFSVDYANENILYAGCSRGYILKTTDGGETWTATGEINPPVEPSFDKHADCFVGIWVDKYATPSGVNVWAIADNSGLIVRTTDGGQNWERHRDKFPNNDWQVDPGYGIEPVNEANFGITAETFNINHAEVSLSSGKIGYTEDGGANWSINQFPNETTPCLPQWFYGIDEYYMGSCNSYIGSSGLIFPQLGWSEGVPYYDTGYDIKAIMMDDSYCPKHTAGGTDETILYYPSGTPVGEPTPVTITDVQATGGNQCVNLEWSWQGTSSCPSEFSIFRSLTQEGLWECIDASVYMPVPPGYYTDESVTHNMTYYYTVNFYFGVEPEPWAVWPVDGDAPYNLPSHTPPDPPLNFSAQDVGNDHGNKIDLSWSSVSGADCYYIYRSPSGHKNRYEFLKDITQLSCTDSTSLTGYPVSYELRTFDGVGVSTPSQTTGIPDDNLSPPKVTGLTGYWEPVEKTIYLKWNPVQDTLEPNLGGYWVCPIAISPGGDSIKGNLNNISPIDRTWYQEKRSDPVGTELVYKVAAMDRSGNVGEWSDEYVIKVTSGCPFLYAKNSTEFVEDNNILPTSEQNPGKDVTDNYRLEKQLTEQEEGYELKITEYENEYNYLNQIKLKTVDHPAEIDVIVDQDGKILAIENETEPLSCSDEKSEDQKPKISQIDGNCYIAAYGSYLIVTMDSTISNPVIHPWITVKAAYLPQLKVADGDTWVDIAPVLSRWNWSGGGIALPQGTDKIKIEFFAENRLDYLGIASCSDSNINVQECNLIKATDSNGNSVKDDLLEIDDKYAELTPDDVITVCFDVPKEQGVERNFVFVTTGYYIKDGGGGGQTADGNTSNIHSLYLYPNPTRNEINIKFSIPEDGKVSLKIYDVSGREIKTLVNDKFDAGYHIIRLDYKNLPSGIYFARLLTDSYEETKKLVLIK